MNLDENSKKRLNRIAAHCISEQLSITCAESCTGGGLAYAFTSLSGASAWFGRSFVTYSNQAKTDMLNVPSVLLDSFGAVSSEVVHAMAVGALVQAHADLALSISGVAGPDGGSDAKPVGIVWFGLAQKGGTHPVHTIEKRFAGDRQAVREQAVAFAIALIAGTFEIDDTESD
jgi:nicotinamide-nucleotide amidase